MAIIGTITHITAKSLTNITDTTQKHTFWKTNFNMPVENLFGNVTTWTRNNGPVTHGSPAVSFSLTGFSPGYEVVVFSSIWDWENTGPGSVSLSASLYNKWVDTDDATTLVQGLNGYAFSYASLPAGSWTEYMYAINIGVASWEIDQNSTYHTKSSATGTHAISEVNTTITTSNVPSVTQLGTSTKGFIWVESNDLCFVNDNQWKHTIVGTFVNTTPGTSKAGFMWIDTSNDLHWVGANGSDYKVPWKVQQFASYFSNGPTSEVNAGTSKAGFIWVDNEFGSTHLSYIGYNGYKWLVGSGEDPYA